MNRISEIIANHLDGAFDASSTAVLAEVLDACDATLKPASITINIKIEPTDEGVYRLYIAEPKVTIPKHPPLPWRAYRAAEGHLSRKHPRQLDLDDIVPSPTPTI